MQIDIGGARPVDADRIAAVYSAGFVMVYNPRSGKAVDRALKTMEPWQLVEMLGGTEVFASWVLDAEYDAVGWFRRSLIRGVVRGLEIPGPKGTNGPWSLVQMVYNWEIPEPFDPRPDGGYHWAFTTPLTVEETWEVINARGPVIRPTRPQRPPKPVPDMPAIEKALTGDEVLCDVMARVVHAARPQVHLEESKDFDTATAFLVDVEGQESPKLLAVVELAGVDPRIGLPGAGSLSFLHDARGRVWGQSAKHAGSFSVVYSDMPARQVVEGRSGVVPMAAKTGVGLPAIDSTDGESVCFETEKQEDAYVDLLAEIYGEPGFPSGVPGTWLGGHPYQLQDDMQEECAKLAAKAWGLDSKPEEWRLLFQLASESAANMKWGDEGFLYYWIRESDLASGDFSRVWCMRQTM